MMAFYAWFLVTICNLRMLNKKLTFIAIPQLANILMCNKLIHAACKRGLPNARFN